MSFIDGLRHRMHVLFRRDTYMRDVERELLFHVELQTLSRTATLETEHDAEIEARRLVGNLTYYREETRRMTLLRWLDRVHQDVVYAVRGLRRFPGFTVTVIVTLALGFGVNAAMYSMLDQVFRREPAGVANPNQVRRVYQDLKSSNDPSGRIIVDNFTFPHFRALSSAASSVSMTAFTKPDSVALIDGATRIPAQRSLVTANYFRLLGLQPALGRFFAAEEERIETPAPVAVISNAFWHREFEADTRVIGRKVSLNHQPVTIIGVGPIDFTGVDLDVADIWLPANMFAASNTSTPWYENYYAGFRVLMRVRSAADEAQLLAVGPAALRGVHILYLLADSTARVATGPLIDADGPMKPAQEVEVATKISWISLIVLLIAAANVTNLLLLRAASRRREITVRRALGVSYARLCEQLVIESTVLALLGGMSALIVAYWTGTALRRLMMPRVHWPSGPVDTHTLLFLLGTSLIIGVTTGLAPAIHAMRPNLTDSLKAGMNAGSYQRSVLRSALLVAQAALCVMLLVGAGLFARSLQNVKSIDVGYGVDDVVTLQPILAPSGGPPTDITSALSDATEQLSRVQGVEASGYAMVGPMLGFAFGSLFLPDRDSLPTVRGDGGPSFNVVSADYFRAAGLAVRSGRAFTNADNAQSSLAVIVSERMARTYWPGATAIGKCLIVGNRSSRCSIVVGVVADAHRERLIEQPVMQYYLPLSQTTSKPRVLVVRTRSGRQRAIATEAEEILNHVMPGLDGVSVETMSAALEPELRPWHLGATLFTAFGVLAMVVAGIGVYSVVAYGVTQRTHEMGVRMALGARTADIADLVFSEGIRLLVVGISLGLAGALALGRFVSSLLFGVTAYDPSVLIGATTALCALGLIACAVPAWRATRVDPAIALRSD
jgi:predicted permease